MSVYMIFTREETLDEQEMVTYSQGAMATLAGHDVNVLAAYGAHEDLEGPSTEGSVVLKFPTAEAAKAWYNSPSYRAVREHRFKGARYRLMLIEGVDGRG